jgi:hypothetical protein
MTPTGRQALQLFGAALVLGVLADILAHTVPDRVKLAAWIVGALGVALALVRMGTVRVPRVSYALAAGTLIFALALIGRDAEPLFAFNVLTALTLLVLAAPRAAPGRLRAAGIADLARAGVESAACTLAGPLPAAAMDVDWSEVGVPGRRRGALAAAGGLLAVLPVLILFGSLLSSADPLFARLLRSLFAFDLNVVAEHVVVIAAATWLAAGFVRWAFVARPKDRPALPAGAGIGVTAVAAALGAVALLFAAFVAVELRYLFGGDALVRSLTGLSYAEYARQGFFQLTWVAGLSVPLLLAADWLVGTRDAGAQRLIRRLGGILVLLIAVILASAMLRMRLYVSAYGLTEQRLYATAIMLWLGAVFVVFAVTVLRGHRERFASAALLAGVAGVLLLNLANPDAIIARTDLARAGGPGQFDPAYVGTLSADAIPAIAAALPALPVPAQCALRAALRHRWRESEGSSAWTLSRASARGRIDDLAGQTPPGCPATSATPGSR